MSRGFVLVLFALGWFGGYAGYQLVLENPQVLETLGVPASIAQPLANEEPCPPLTLDPLREAEATVWSVYCSVPSPTALDQKGREAVTSTVRELTAGLSEYLQQDPKPADAQTAEELALRARFVGAKLAPDVFAASFRSYADDVRLRNEAPALTLQADAYALLESISVEEEVAAEDLDRLAQFVDQYPDSPLGAVLFAYVADGLWRNERASSAEAVLQRGIQVFAGKPTVSQLVNQLVDQGHRKPPPPRWTEAEWNSLNRAAEALATHHSSSAGTSCTIVRKG